MKTLVIVPTYNERENIQSLIPAILAAVPAVEILVVDDSSPDGTAQVVNSLKEKYPQVHLLLRSNKQGLGRAYLAGFAWGIKNRFDALVEMDADFSHRPEDLKKIIAQLENQNTDFVVGSRYIPGGAIEAWTWPRWFVSKSGSSYARMVLGYPLNDWTGGFNAWKSKVLEKIGLGRIISNGYCFQIELKYKALKNGFHGEEVPIYFANRVRGQSKMSWRILAEAFYKIWVIRCA